MNYFDEDFFQWAHLLLIVILLLLSFTTLRLARSNTGLAKDVHETKGKVDVIADTYIKIFADMHERLTAAVEKDD